jgi:hypothetical protein
MQKYDQIIEDQNLELIKIDNSLENLTLINKQINEHLKVDKDLLAQTDKEMDTTYSRVRATTNKIKVVIGGSRCQIAIIIILIIFIAIIAYFVFV